MVRKNEQDQLDDLERKIEQLKARKQQIQARLSTKERKERTRRLIQVGAIFEKHFGLLTLEEAERVAERFRDDVRAFLTKEEVEQLSG